MSTNLKLEGFFHNFKLFGHDIKITKRPLHILSQIKISKDKKKYRNKFKFLLKKNY